MLYAFHGCSGVIIGVKNVLTAASCLKYDPDNYRVFAGSNYHGNETESQVRSIVRFVKHPKFQRDRSYDIALLYLVEKFVYNTNIHPIKLPKSTTEQSLRIYYALSRKKLVVHAVVIVEVH